MITWLAVIAFVLCFERSDRKFVVAGVLFEQLISALWAAWVR